LDAQDPDLLEARHEATSPSGELLQAVLGRRLRRLRAARGWSCQLVAARLGIPAKRVAAQEDGLRRFAPADLTAYARLYDIRISTFFYP
jgi:transcriptional regulator with XRE-family HTH domain